MDDQKNLEMNLGSPSDMALLMLQARIAKGFSQQEVADNADAYRPYISRMETNDIHLPYLERFFDTMKMCGVTLTATFENKAE